MRFRYTTQTPAATSAAPATSNHNNIPVPDSTTCPRLVPVPPQLTDNSRPCTLELLDSNNPEPVGLARPLQEVPG